MAVRSTQFGAGETIVLTDYTMLQAGYVFLPSCTSDLLLEEAVAGGASWGPAEVLGVLQDVANRVVPQLVAEAGEQPGPPRFCHTGIDAQRVDDGSVKAPQVVRVPDPQWFYQNCSRRW